MVLVELVNSMLKRVPIMSGQQGVVETVNAPSSPAAPGARNGESKSDQSTNGKREGRKALSAATKLKDGVERYLSDCRRRNLSTHSIKFYANRLHGFCQFLGERASKVSISKVSAEMIEDFVDEEFDRIGEVVAQDTYVSLHAFFNYVLAQGAIKRNPMEKMIKPKCKRKLIPTLTLAQVDSMIATCDDSFNGLRNRAIMLMLLDCGVRVSELCGILLHHIDWANQRILIDQGKGGKQRWVPFAGAARDALDAYLKMRGTVNGGAEVFISRNGVPMTRQSVDKCLKSCAGKAGISGVRVSAHTFRHTFAVTYLRNGGDAFTLQKMLGHTDLTMTRRYCELVDDDVRRSHRMFSPGDSLQKSAEGRMPDNQIPMAIPSHSVA